jgi:hypothetical protein
VAFALAPAHVDAYLAAVGDRCDYGGRVPPLAVLAAALAALQEQVALPDGSLHTGQEVETIAPAQAGEQLTMTGRIAQRSERQGMVISVIELEAGSDAGPRLRARTTIMAPAV